MYALILTILFAAQHGTENSTSMQALDGFSSLAACQAAGDAWLKQQNERPELPYLRRPQARAICVKK
jgi:hypothetical protein